MRDTRRTYINHDTGTRLMINADDTAHIIQGFQIRDFLRDRAAINRTLREARRFGQPITREEG